MANPFFMRHLISANQLSRSDIDFFLPLCYQFKKQTAHPPFLKNKILASCFFEASTRTRLSFESACLKLGGQVIGFHDHSQLSIQKGETLADTMRMIGEYADLIILRHYAAGAAQLAADISGKPVINAGDGAHEHPTQALIDLFTIHELHNQIDGLRLAITGDIIHARTIHSLIILLCHFDVRLYFVTPFSFQLPDYISTQLRHSGVRYSLHQQFNEVIDKLDILYLVRIQKERLPQSIMLEKNGLDFSQLVHAKENLKILHPLPRCEELPVEIDAMPFAHYFQQAANAIPVRQALMSLIMQETLS